MERITREMVQRRLETLKRLHLWAATLDLDVSSEGLKLVRHEDGGERNISPRGTARETYFYLEAYREGAEAVLIEQREQEGKRVQVETSSARRRYSVRRPGETSWVDTDHLEVARRSRWDANRTVTPGHLVIDNLTGEEVE